MASLNRNIININLNPCGVFRHHDLKDFTVIHSLNILYYGVSKHHYSK